jgi:hypothetical protein
MSDTELQEVGVGYGKAVFASKTLAMTSQRVKAPFIREPAATTGQRQYGNQSARNVGQHGDINGVIYGDRVKHPNGTILMLGASQKTSRAPLADAAVFVRLRAGAPLIAINCRLPVDRANYFGETACLFTGRADIMSVDEVEALGLRIPRSFVERFCEMDEIQQLFDIIEVAPEVIARPSIIAVVTPTGTEVREVSAAPVRRIKIRK